jgi:hypothetical protein
MQGCGLDWAGSGERQLAGNLNAVMTFGFNKRKMRGIS